jgi:hypothetical protein
MFVVRGPAGEPAGAPPGDVDVRRAESTERLTLQVDVHRAGQRVRHHQRCVSPDPR